VLSRPSADSFAVGRRQKPLLSKFAFPEKRARGKLKIASEFCLLRKGLQCGSFVTSANGNIQNRKKSVLGTCFRECRKFLFRSSVSGLKDLNNFVNFAGKARRFESQSQGFESLLPDKKDQQLLKIIQIWATLSKYLRIWNVLIQTLLQELA
jgi:hypothetical protein